MVKWRGECNPVSEVKKEVGGYECLCETEQRGKTKLNQRTKILRW